MSIIDETHFITEEKLAKLYADDKPLPGTIIKDMKYATPPSPSIPKGITPEQHDAIQMHIKAGANVTTEYHGGVLTDVTIEYDNPYTGATSEGFTPGSYVYNEAHAYMTPQQWHKIGGSGPQMNTPEKYGEWKESSIASPPKSTIEVLDRAEAAIDELGWIQGALHSKEGVCMMGAIDLVAPMHNGVSDLHAYAKEALLHAIQNNMLFELSDDDKIRGVMEEITIPEFNDSENATLESVKLAFKHARHSLSMDEGDKEML